MASPTFTWYDNAATSKLLQEFKILKNNVELWQSSYTKYLELKEFAQISSHDQGLLAQIKKDLDKLQSDVDGLEFKTLFKRPV